MKPADLRLPSIDGLLAFEAIARLGQLERAAEELHVSASAVGKRLGALEDLLGTVLINRAAKPLALTVAGKEYLAQVREALALLSAMPLHQRQNQKRERLRITTPPTFARQILVPALPAFTAAWPQVELELVLSVPFLDESAAPTADVEIRTEGVDESQILMRDRATPMAAPSLLARLPALAEPADLLRHGAPLLRTPLEPWSPWFGAAGLAAEEPAEGTRYVDLGLTLEAAVCGQGVALARPCLAAPYLRSGALVRLFALSVPAAKRYGLVQHSDSAAAAGFARWLHEHCRALAAEEKTSGAG